MKNDVKMSKSKGNFITLDTLVEKGYNPLAYRYLILTSHYRSPLIFSYENLDAAAQALNNLKTKYAELLNDKNVAYSAADEAKLNGYLQEFDEHLFNDLHTPQAIALLWKVLKDKDLPASCKLKFLDKADEIFALDVNVPAEKTTSSQRVLDDDTLKLIEERKAARQAKNWAKSDEIRDLLLSRGIILKDMPGNEVEISFK